VQVFPRSGVYWEAYTRIWTAGQLGRYFWNSTLVATIATGASVALSVFAAIGFARYKL
jgi:ABC-type glycerol-3-phosphate transport system permease component